MTTVTGFVDFGLKARRNDLSGFLVGMDNSSSPRNEIIAQLRPRMWRTAAGATGLTSRINSIDKNILSVVTLSGIYGYADSTPDPYKGNPAPYSDANVTWKATVTPLATYHKGQNVIFDVWNEPDLSTSYDGSQSQFFDTFKAAHDAIRAVWPQALILGPSTANYNSGWNSAFLSYCTTNSLTVDAFAYHEFVDSDPSVIPSHISAIKTLVASNPNVGVKKYYLTEHTRDTSWMNPGDCLNYLYYMGEAGVHGAIRACWNNLSSVNSCFDNSIDNLVDSATGNPHAVYYAYSWYAEIKKALVACTSGDSYLAIMASSTPAEVLVGFGNSATSTIDVSLTLKNLGAIGANSSSVKVDIYMVSATGETIVNKPTYLPSRVLSVSNGQASLTLSGVNKHDLYKLVIRPF